MLVFARYFRGFEHIEVDLQKITFLVGDNSSGKTSIAHLVEAVCKSDLGRIPSFDEDYGIGEFDYFSPYFDNRDVIMGFSVNSHGEEFYKALTISKDEDGDPFVSKCSYYYNGIFLSIRFDGRLISTYTSKISSAVSVSSFIKRHESARKYRRFGKAISYNICDSSALFTYFDVKSSGSEIIVRGVSGARLWSARMLAATRALPSPFYNFRRKISVDGIHFPVMLIDIGVGSAFEEYRADINNFGLEAGLFDALEVSKISQEVQNSPIIVSVDKNGRKFLLNQVGVGVSQVVPVLVDAMFALADRETVLLVQQPELHLHPRAQAAFGSYLFKACKKGLRGVFETHSSFLLDRFRSEIRDDRDDGLSNITEIMFCYNDSKGNHVKSVKIDSRGRLNGDDDDFHQFFVDELVRTML